MFCSFWKVTRSINGHTYDFLFDSRYAADEYCKLVNGSIRKYTPRNLNTFAHAWNQTNLVKRWLLENGFDFWHDEPVVHVEYREYTDEDDDLPF